jgi:hypothetical protein
MFHQSIYARLKYSALNFLKDKGYDIGSVGEKDGFIIFPKQQGCSIGIYYIPRDYNIRSFTTTCEVANTWLDLCFLALQRSALQDTGGVVRKIEAEPINGWPWIYLSETFAHPDLLTFCTK